MRAEFAAFAPLAFIQTRPPWVLERKPELPDHGIHRLASQMVAASDDSREHVPERARRRLARRRRSPSSARCPGPAPCCCPRGRHLRRLRGRALSLRDRRGGGSSGGHRILAGRIDRLQRMAHNGSGCLPASRLIVVLILCALLSCPGYAAAQQTGGGVIEGFVTTQSGTIRLGGAQVVLHDSANQEISTVLSEGDGRFRFTALQEGKYALTASLDGFAHGARHGRGRRSTRRLSSRIDLPIATLTQTVEVMAPASDRLGGRHARLGRLDRRPRNRPVRERQRDSAARCACSRA